MVQLIVGRKDVQSKCLLIKMGEAYVGIAEFSLQEQKGRNQSEENYGYYG